MPQVLGVTKAMTNLNVAHRTLKLQPTVNPSFFSESYGFSVMQALPQTLTYMSAQPGPGEIAYGLITTGEDYLFVKLDGRTRGYALSDKLTLSTRRTNQLYTVIQILKRLTAV